MKKQIVTMMMIVSTVIGSQVQAQTGVADNLTQKIAQSDVPDNMLSLLTALNAYSVHNNVMDRGEKSAKLGDFRDCSNEDLIKGTCTQELGMMMAAVIDIKLADNKIVKFTSVNCDRGLAVRDPNNYEIDLYGELEFGLNGTYVVTNKNYQSCTVQVQVLDK